MTKKAILDEILRLSLQERLELIGEAWDSLAESADLPSPDWHVAEVERRLGDLDPVHRDWGDVLRDLRGTDRA